MDGIKNNRRPSLLINFHSSFSLSLLPLTARLFQGDIFDPTVTTSLVPTHQITLIRFGVLPLHQHQWPPPPYSIQWLILHSHLTLPIYPYQQLTILSFKKFFSLSLFGFLCRLSSSSCDLNVGVSQAKVAQHTSLHHLCSAARWSHFLPDFSPHLQTVGSTHIPTLTFD